MYQKILPLYLKLRVPKSKMKHNLTKEIQGINSLTHIQRQNILLCTDFHLFIRAPRAQPTLYPDVHIIVTSFFVKRKLRKEVINGEGWEKCLRGPVRPRTYINNFGSKVVISKSLDPISILQIGRTTNFNNPTRSFTIQRSRCPRSFLS